MRSIKPGRGPSFMGGISSLASAVFGIFWTIFVAGMGGGVFAIFGLIFVFVGIAGAVYNFKNATSKNRYSMFDITDHNEEPDPLNVRYGEEARPTNFRPYTDTTTKEGEEFCPYCGNPVKKEYEFCNKCGNKLP